MSVPLPDGSSFDEDLIPHDWEPDNLPYESGCSFLFDTNDLPSFSLCPQTLSLHQHSDSLPLPYSPILFDFPEPKCGAEPPRLPFARAIRSPPPPGDFQSACTNRSLIFKPYKLGFLPIPWTQRKRTFGDLVSGFFTRKSSANSRFLHKLTNALKIGEIDENYFELVGVAWLTDQVIKVDKMKFARLLGIKSIEGSLFHQQGNFPSHGFIEIGASEARKCSPLRISRGSTSTCSG
jgi:hypothetical protein